MTPNRTQASDYIKAVLDLYVRLPGTRNAPSRQDRRLAADLQRRAVPLERVRAALLLAAARRTLRSPDAPALPPIGCLHYFLPVVDELTLEPPDPGYVDYLQRKLRPFLAPGPQPSTPGQKTSHPRGR